MAGPTQPQVFDEEWDDERIKGFLDLTPHDAGSVDHYALLKAYRGMRADDFERFLAFFNEAGRDLTAQDEAGQTLLDIVRDHRQGAPYAASLEKWMNA